MTFDAERVRLNVRQAATEDLLDRITVYRDEMEPEAVLIVEWELCARGIGSEQIIDHVEKRAHILHRPNGAARRCSLCPRPAIIQEQGWHRLLGLVPIFPRTVYYCEKHAHQPGSSG